jgi:hypothetical protein
MQPIDKPFRPKWDFYIIWTLLAVTTYLLLYRAKDDWYSYCALVILLSLFETFVLYGSVLLGIQVVRSGSRGRFVAKVLISTLAGVIILCFILYISGYGNKNSEMWSGLIIAGSMIYLHWRLRNGPHE